jgi:hypothetical protein
MNNDIWFDLCVGNIEIDDSGLHSYLPNLSRLVTLSDENIEDIKEHRSTLHVLLDQAIDHISREMEK